MGFVFKFVIDNELKISTSCGSNVWAWTVFMKAKMSVIHSLSDVHSLCNVSHVVILTDSHQYGNKQTNKRKQAKQKKDEIFHDVIEPYSHWNVRTSIKGKNLFCVIGKMKKTTQI